MTIIDMLQQSLFLTLLGMGVVFAFLIILIVCMTLSHKVLHALKLDQEAVERRLIGGHARAAGGNAEGKGNGKIAESDGKAVLKSRKKRFFIFLE